jgi:hypothetical protein
VSSEFFYTSDGKIRRRRVGGSTAETVAFTATLGVTPRYTGVPVMSIHGTAEGVGTRPTGSHQTGRE